MVAVIDSGVHATHPHVGGVSGGFAIRDDGTLADDYVDRLGHGTAVTAAIREKAPAAGILAIKVFWSSLATNVTMLARATMRPPHKVRTSSISASEPPRCSIATRFNRRSRVRAGWARSWSPPTTMAGFAGCLAV